MAAKLRGKVVIADARSSNSCICNDMFSGNRGRSKAQIQAVVRPMFHAVLYGLDAALMSRSCVRGAKRKAPLGVDCKSWQHDKWRFVVFDVRIVFCWLGDSFTVCQT